MLAELQSLLLPAISGNNASKTAGAYLISVTTSLVLAWSTWRIWAFTIRPMLYPREPKELPYLIPVIGHMISFFKDSEATFSYAREYFGNTREPFALTIAGQRMYVVTSPQDVTAVYKNASTLTFEEFLRDMMKSVGLSADAMRKAWPPGNKDSGSRKALAYIAEDIYRKQLLPGDQLTILWASIHSQISSRLQWDSISPKAIEGRSDNEMTVSLWRLCRQVLVEGVTTAIFGPSLLKLDPNLVETFASFDDNSWQLTYKLPPSAAKDMFAARHRIWRMFEDYFNLDKDRRPDAAWLIDELESEMRGAGLDTHDTACLFLMPLWVINSNAYKQCFWVMVYLLSSQALYAEVHKEVQGAVSSGPQDSLEERLQKDCPRLVAIYYEVLRLNTASASARGIASDTDLGNVTLKAGNSVLVPYRQLHMDQAAWGMDAETFNADRFLQKKNLVRSPSFRPFGGGITYCSGTHVAIREVLTFVALLMTRYDVRVAKANDGKTSYSMPVPDATMPTLGLLPPKRGQDLKLILRQKM